MRKIGDEYVIQLNDDGLPKLRISGAYRKLLRGGNGAIGSRGANYLKDKMRSAVWLIKSLDQRQRTIYKVADSIVRHQREFLDHGIEHLRPMVLRDVANDIGMHESTVSPRGLQQVHPHAARPLPDEVLLPQRDRLAYGDDISSLTVKSKIERIVQDEDTRRPLSDARSCSGCGPRGSRSPAGRSPSTATSSASPLPPSENRSFRRDEWPSNAPDATSKSPRR